MRWVPFLLQSVVQLEGSAYKIMAAAVGDGPVDRATIDAFLSSVQITPPKLQSQYSPAEPSQWSSGSVSFHELSKKIGGMGFAALIVLGLWQLCRRLKRESR